jgi:uncharacterized membrane protein YvbJ
MYCSKCGKEIPDTAVFCPECGNPTNPIDKQQLNYNQPAMQDDPSTLANVASCCFPIVGLVLYLVWKDSKPRSASSVCRWTIGGFVAFVVVYILAALIGAFSAASGF